MRPQHPVAVTPHEPRHRPAPHSRPPASKPTALPRYRPRRQPAPGSRPPRLFGHAGRHVPCSRIFVCFARRCRLLALASPRAAAGSAAAASARARACTCTAAAASPHIDAGTSTVVCACARARSCLLCTGLESLGFFAKGWSRTSRRAPIGTTPSLEAHTRLLSCFRLLSLFARNSFLFLSQATARLAAPAAQQRTRTHAPRTH